jgi:hypothetical protein
VCEYGYTQLLLPHQIALYIGKNIPLKTMIEAPPKKCLSRWYLQVLDDGSRVLVSLGLAAEVASDGL